MLWSLREKDLNNLKRDVGHVLNPAQYLETLEAKDHEKVWERIQAADLGTTLPHFTEGGKYS